MGSQHLALIQLRSCPHRANKVAYRPHDQAPAAAPAQEQRAFVGTLATLSPHRGVIEGCSTFDAAEIWYVYLPNLPYVGGEGGWVRPCPHAHGPRPAQRTESVLVCSTLVAPPLTASAVAPRSLGARRLRARQWGGGVASNFCKGANSIGWFSAAAQGLLKFAGDGGLAGGLPLVPSA